MSTTGKMLSVWPSGNEWDQLQQIDAHFFPRPWTLHQWYSLIDSQNHLYRWMLHGKLLGFALFGHLKGDGTAHLLKICLMPEHRGNGESLAFWSEVVADLKNQGVENIYLEVEESNQRAQGFYKKVGFVTLRTVKAYYSDGQNGVMMLLTM